jgi:catechol 2,3-dioxygenase-like lactoylglutathione lyase family enzyme
VYSVEMVKTYGLTHVALAVADPERSMRFYERVLGMVPVYRTPDFIQAQTPGSRDVLVFEKKPETAGPSGGILHFGFRLQNEEDITTAIQSIEDAGGFIVSQGEFCEGEPFVFFRDPDGYEVEIWHEIPTPLDPEQ